MSGAHRPESYHVLVLHAQNWRHLHHDKVWKPLVTLDIDGHPTHMVRLGVDGQNPDRRVPMVLHDVHRETTIKICLWHKSENKAKKKKVASTSVSVGHAMASQDKYRSFRLSLDTTTRNHRKIAKTQSVPSLHIRITLPRAADADASALFSGDETFVGDSLFGDFSELLGLPSTSTNSDPAESALFQEIQEMPRSSTPPRCPRRRHTNRTASLDTPQHLSDDEDQIKFNVVPSSSSWLAAPGTQVAEPSSLLTPLTDTETLLGTPNATPAAIEDCVRSEEELAADKDAVPPTVSVTFAVLERVGRGVRELFEMLTYYAELRDAQSAANTQRFNEVLVCLRREWYVVGGSLISVVAVDATVLGFSHDNIFPVDTVAKRALIVSSIAAALGIIFDAWFLLIYSNTSGRRFQTLAIDLYSKYIFFALSSRLPLLAILIAALALALFLLAEAWSVWPAAVAVMCGIAFLLVSLQGLAYGVRAGTRGARACWGVGRAAVCRICCWGGRTSVGSASAGGSGSAGGRGSRKGGGDGDGDGDGESGDARLTAHRAYVGEKIK